MASESNFKFSGHSTINAPSLKASSKFKALIKPTVKDEELPKPVPAGISATEFRSHPHIFVFFKQPLINGCLIFLNESTTSVLEYFKKHLFL